MDFLNINFFGMTLYSILCYFIIYSFAGWILEVVYHALTIGKVVNRGFLVGPLCPVYGFGILSIGCLTYLAGYSGGLESIHLLPLGLLFVGGLLLATLIELVAGFLLDILFHARWWDYSDRPFNLHGYICGEFSLIWGMGITFVLRILHPYIHHLSQDLLPRRLGLILLLLFYISFLCDLIITVLSIRKMEKQLREFEKIRKSLLFVSDNMSRILGDGTLEAVSLLEDKKEKASAILDGQREKAYAILDGQKEKASAILDGQKEKASAILDELAAKKERLEEQLEELQRSLFRHPYIGAGRLIRGFHNLKHRDYDHTIQNLRNWLKDRQKNKPVL